MCIRVQPHLIASRPVVGNNVRLRTSHETRLTFTDMPFLRDPAFGETVIMNVHTRNFHAFK